MKTEFPITEKPAIAVSGGYKPVIPIIEFICICPNGLEYTKGHVEDMKAWQKIVKNYLKINRLYETESL
ncbi:MAG TPA: hypothetical protein VK528_11980 [Flavobacterium sp.]|nr:hypothetical protein [Flavobacterium sp.]